MLIISSLTGEVKDANNICVKCPPGTYYRKVTETVTKSTTSSDDSADPATIEACVPCQPGTFQDKVSQTINQLLNLSVPKSLRKPNQRLPN